MRLSALGPTLEDAGEGAAYLEFACPVHGVGAMRSGDPASMFARWPDTVKIKIAVPLESQHPQVWGWNGERDFEKLTVHPSIDYPGHWHGFVKDGEVTNA